MQAPEYVYELTSTSMDGVGMAEPSWLAQMEAAGVVCAPCKDIRSGQARHIESVTVEKPPPLHSHMSIIGYLGRSHVLSTRLIAILGRSALERFGRLVPIFGPAGERYDEHEALIPERASGTIRGPDPHEPCVCRVCGRLCYWPGWPPSKWYILRRDWRPGTQLSILGGWLLVSEEVFEQQIKPAKLPKVKGNRVALRDQPLDGLPADYEELRQALTAK